MGVYIKNMTIPKSCGVCRFAGICEVLNTEEWPDLESIMFNEVIGINGVRDPDCPLIEISSHGDLIDRDAARRSIKPWSPEDEKNSCTFDTVKKLMHTMLDRTPTIIPAEL